jgi:CHAT domain-containing protein
MRRVPCCWRSTAFEPIQSGCLAVGYDGTHGQLRHTEREARFIADLTGGQALIGPQLKRDQLRDLSRDRRWLHFACHGQFNTEAPLDSFLEIAGEERLTAREILQDWRITAELVTLSACETGVSRILRGDEPLGLIRSFLHAGAGAVLVSQWPVEDLPTFLFMQQFYRLLFERNTSNLAQALIAAQHWLRNLTVAEVESQLIDLTLKDASVEQTGLTLSPEARPFAHPRYWSGFQTIGQSLISQGHFNTQFTPARAISTPSPRGQAHASL